MIFVLQGLAAERFDPTADFPAPWQCVVLSSGDGVIVGTCAIKGRRLLVDVATCAEVTVASAGRAHNALGTVSAERVGNAYNAGKLTELLPLSGSFAICIIDSATGVITVVSDALAATPLFYCAGREGFAIAPSARTALTLLKAPLDISDARALTYLAGRYMIDGQPLFAGVSRIRPARIIRYSIRTGSLDETTYWDLKFDPVDCPDQVAVDGLYNILKSSHQNELSSLGGDSYDLLLTGGMDSRGALAFCNESGKLPLTARTWAEHKTQPHSDPVIAARLAAKFGVPHVVEPLDAAGWSVNSLGWSLVSDLLNDNGSSYASGFNYFSASSASKTFLIGDQAFGFGPLPGSRNEAVSNLEETAARAALPELGGFIDNAALSEVLRQRRSFYSSLADECLSEDPKDIQDYLFFHAHVFPWLVGSGNFKEPCVNVIRPMMTWQVLDYIGSVRPGLRVDKVLYSTMLKRRFPGVQSVPLASATGGTDVGESIAKCKEFRAWLWRHTHPDRVLTSKLGRYFNADAYAAYWQNIFSMATEKHSHMSSLHKRLYEWRRVVSRQKHLNYLSKRVQPLVSRTLGVEQRKRRNQRYQLMCRIALFVQAEAEWQR